MNRLTLFYTYHLAGKLDDLPRLYTYLQQLKADYDAPKALLIDLGRSCDEDVWHCRATRGRSTLIVLDGMGYHIANVSDIIAPAQRSQLRRVVTMALVDERHSWRYDVPPVRDDGIVVSVAPSPALRLCIVCAPAEATTLAGGVLTLGVPEDSAVSLSVGVAVLTLDDVPRLTHHAHHRLPQNVKAHPTVVSTVDFVLEEARQHERGGFRDV